MARNLAQWLPVVVRAPRAKKLPRPPLAAAVAVVLVLIVTVACMFLLDTAASAWARRLPLWFKAAFE